LKGNSVTVSVGELTAGVTTQSEQTDANRNRKESEGLVLSSGESAKVAVEGLLPKSKVKAVIFSEPRNLGELQVDEFGNLAASIQIPKDMEAGAHTLVLSGSDKYGKQIELKFGLVVYSPSTYIPIWIWVILGLLVVSLIVAIFDKKKSQNLTFR